MTQSNVIMRHLYKSTDVFTRHEPANKKWTLNEIFKTPFIAKYLTKTLAKEADFIDVQRPVANYYNPPIVHENSIFLYQSEQVASKLRRARYLEFPTIGLFLLGVPSIGMFALYGAIFWYLNARSLHYEPSKRVVVRMDLLPHLEMIAM